MSVQRCVYLFITCNWPINLASVRTPAAVYHGKRDATLARRKEAKNRASPTRRDYIRTIGERGSSF
ncbi:MAG: hypothetical protein KAV87_59475, partial [Desulfobacteraceae bacterium]|nr:hypothetical protein [Desulfobacteraceae bacterium]